jgi:diguanylate cyclase (GGDEF)-like protein/PAS domain S-box-containing protein
MRVWRRTLYFLLAILLVMASFDLDQRLSASLADHSSAILYLPAIIVASYLGGLGPGLLATAAALIATLPLLVDFGHSDFNPNLADHVHWLLLLLSGVLISVLNTHARHMERKLAQTEALQESEARFRGIVQDQTELISRFDRKGRLTYVNDAFCQFFGRSYPEWIDKRWSPLASADDLERVETELARLSLHQPVVTLEYRVTDARGRLRWMQFVYRALYDAEGHRIETQAIGRDISDLHEAMQALGESSRRMQILFEQAQDGILLLDRQGRLREANASFARMLGYTPEELKQLSVWDWDAQWSRAELENWLTRAEPVATSFETRHRCKDGSTYDAEVSVTPIEFKGEWMVFCFCRDVSLQKAAEDKLRQAASVFEAAGEGIIIADRDACITDVNPAFSRITGYSREEVLGRNPRLFQSGRQGPDFYAALWRSLQEHGHWQGEIWNRYKDGQLHAEALTITALRSHNGRIDRYIALFSEITSRKLEQEELAHRAFHDPLTGLPNRALFYDRLGVALATAQRNSRMLAVAYMDLDDFKPVNDRHGHEVGDQLLVELARRLIASTRAQDTVARLGGDEFVLLLNEFDGQQEALHILERVRTAVADPYLLGPSISARVTASIGVAFHPVDADEVGRLILYADQAMYRAKLSGHNCICCFDPALDAGSAQEKAQIAP